MSTEVPKIYRNVAAIIAIGLCCAASRMAFGADNPQPSVSDQPAAQDLEQSRAFDIFQKEIEPLLGREIAEESCQSCHEEGGTSQLVLPGTAAEDFRALLNGGYLFRDGPDTLLARILTKNPKTRMPKGKHAIPWTDEEIGKVKTFLSALGEVAKLDGHADEQFPADLLSPYTGPAPKSLDNQFITYWQLRGKVRTIFHDDWMRNGEDLFEKNIALFGGADFEQRFNETSKASASFLTGLEMLSRDVADRAYTLKNGPFDGRPDEMESP
jgi:mono/diheme cytochrome c family protein